MVGSLRIVAIVPVPPHHPGPSRRQLLVGGAAALLAGCSGRGASSPTAAAPAPAPARGGASAQSVVRPSPSPSPTPTATADPATIVARSHVPILCYHQIREWTADDPASARPYIMPPRIFTAQLDALAAGGYHTVSPDQLVDYLTTGAPLPTKPVMLSYDDADMGGYDVALPEMGRRGFTGTYFVMTVVLGKPRYMSKAQLRELNARGMTVAAHTWDHHRVDRYAGGDWAVQIDQPTRQLADIVGHPIRYFAYPYGVWNAAAVPHLQDAGFDAAFQLNGKPVDPAGPLYTIQRAIANPYWSTDTLLETVASGF